LNFAGKRRYDRKQQGYGGQTKQVFHKKVSWLNINRLEMHSDILMYWNIWLMMVRCHWLVIMCHLFMMYLEKKELI